MRHPFCDRRVANNSKLMFIVFISHEIAGVHYGTGRHFKDIEPDNLVKAMQVSGRPDFILRRGR